MEQVFILQICQNKIQTTNVIGIEIVVSYIRFHSKNIIALCKLNDDRICDRTLQVDFRKRKSKLKQIVFCSLPRYENRIKEQLTVAKQ